MVVVGCILWTVRLYPADPKCWLECKRWNIIFCTLNLHSLQFVIQENETFYEFNSITLVIVLQVSHQRHLSTIHNTLKISIQIKVQVSHLNRLFVKINKTTWLPIAQPTELKHLGVIESLKTFSPMAPFTQGLFTKSAIKVKAEVTALGRKKNIYTFF